MDGHQRTTAPGLLAKAANTNWCTARGRAKGGCTLQNSRGPGEKAQQWLCERVGEEARSLEGVVSHTSLGSDCATTFRTASSAPCTLAQLGRISAQQPSAPALPTPFAVVSALPECFERFKCRRPLPASCRDPAVAPDTAPLCALHSSRLQLAHIPGRCPIYSHMVCPWFTLRLLKPLLATQRESGADWQQSPGGSISQAKIGLPQHRRLQSLNTLKCNIGGCADDAQPPSHCLPRRFCNAHLFD